MCQCGSLVHVRPSYLVLGVLHSILPDEFDKHQLQELLGVGNPIEDSTKEGQRFAVIYTSQRGEGVSLACGIAFAFEQGRDQFGGVRDKRWGVLKDARYGKDCILADVGMSMLKASSRRREQRFDQFWLAQFRQEASVASGWLAINKLGAQYASQNQVLVLIRWRWK